MRALQSSQCRRALGACLAVGAADNPAAKASISLDEMGAIEI